MALFEVNPDGLIPFRQVESGAGGYDEVIEDVLWRNLDGLVGERLFRVRRQAPLDGGGRPAIVALDPDGSVVVIHVRRQIDRTGLAECLEYAGWARAATLDELAMLYWRGESEFWTDWHSFLGGTGQGHVKPAPRIFLATGDFTTRAQSTFEFLVDNGLPVKVMKATIFETPNGHRVLDVEGPSDVETVLRPSAAAEATFERLSRSARRSAERKLDRAPEVITPPVEATQIIGQAPPQPFEPGPFPGRVIEPQRGRPHEQPAERAPSRAIGRELERAPERPAEHSQPRELERGPSRRTPDLLQDPLGGGLLPPPAPLTAEQLRTDPLGMDQIVAGQLANEPDKPERPTDPRSLISRSGPQGEHRPGTAQVHPQAGEPGGDGPFHRGTPPNGRGTPPMPPGMLPPPPPAGFGRTPPEQFDQPLPDQPDVRSLPPRRGQFPPSGPSLSVVPPNPNPEQGHEPDHREQLPEPPSAELPEPGDERPERTRLSDIMDPRMLRVPDGFAWGDPRTANGKRDNNGHRE